MLFAEGVDYSCRMERRVARVCVGSAEEGHEEHGEVGKRLSHGGDGMGGMGGGRGVE